MAKANAPAAPGQKKIERSSTDLNQTLCERAKAGPKQVCLWDAKLRGFCLRITPQRAEKRGKQQLLVGGSKAFYLKLTRTQAGQAGEKLVRATWVRIGSFMPDKGQGLTVELARKRAQKLKDIHEQGGDVRAIREEQKNPDDVAELVKAYTASKAYTRLRKTTRAALDSYLRNYIDPASGPFAWFKKRYVRDLTERDIQKLYDQVEAATSQISANRVLALLSSLMQCAEKKGLRAKNSNPCRGFDKGDPETARQRVLAPTELKKVGATLEAAVAAWNTKPRPRDTCAISEVAADALRFLALTGLRLGEVLPLRWTDVDMDGGTMTFLAHKTSKKQGAKRLPVPPEAMAILKRRAADKPQPVVIDGKARELNPFVFRGHKIGGHLVGLERIWLRVREAAGLDSSAKDGEVRMHDFRRTYHTRTIELGYPGMIADSLLGHSLGKVRDVYTNLDPKGLLMQASTEISASIAGDLVGREPEGGKKVLHAQV